MKSFKPLMLAVVFLFLHSAARAQSDQLLPKEADKGKLIEETVAGLEDLDPVQRVKLKIRMALADYLVSHRRLPETLDELVPLYFDRVPVSPKSGKPFRYFREPGDGRKYYLLDEGEEGAASD